MESQRPEAAHGEDMKRAMADEPLAEEGEGGWSWTATVPSQARAKGRGDKGVIARGRGWPAACNDKTAATT